MDTVLKYKIVEKIIQSNDENLLNEVGTLIGITVSDFWDEVPLDVKKSVNKAKGELDRGEGIPHEQVMREIKSRFLNT